MCITNPLKISDFQGNLLHMLLFSQKHAFYFSILRIKEGLSHVQQPHTWRRRWDSNPRDIAVKLISSQSRYDRFDTSAYLVFIAPPRTAFGKMRDFDAR